MAAIFLIMFVTFSLFVIPIQAEEKDEDLEWRLDLIKSSRAMMETENNNNVYFHRIGTVFTNFGEANFNTGLRVAPSVWQKDKISVHVMGELFYLRKEDDFSSFVSLYSLRNNIYMGAGTEITDKANYHLFVGWEITNNLFLEARAINTEGSISDSKIYPVAGFQIKL